MSNTINILKPSVCFEVQKVIAISSSVGNCTNYQVQWAPSWISGVHLIGCEDLIEQFEDEQRKKEIKIEVPDDYHLQGGGALVVHEAVDNEVIPYINVPDLPEEQLVMNMQKSIAINTEVADFTMPHINCISDSSVEGVKVIPLDSTFRCLEMNGEQGSSTDQSELLSFQSDIPFSENNKDADQGDINSLPATFIVCEATDRGHAEGSQLQQRLPCFEKEDMNVDRIYDKMFARNKVKIKRDVHKMSNMKSKFEKTKTCHICNKTFSEYHRLRRHSKVHAAHQCPICKRKFLSEVNLQKHVLMHGSISSEIQPSFDICKENFSASVKLQSPSQTSTKQGRFQCSICTKLCLSSVDLKRHVRVHTGERPFECMVCHKRFKINHHLKDHSRMHLP